MGVDDPTVLVVHPLRARCLECKVTQVLLPLFLAARRADESAVIATALEAKTKEGLGHRRIAEKVGRPVSTVRGWLRAHAEAAPRLRDLFTTLVLRDAADAAALWPKPVDGALAQALAFVRAYASVLVERRILPSTEVDRWQAAALIGAGPWVFSGTWRSKNGATPIGPDAGAC